MRSALCLALTAALLLATLSFAPPSAASRRGVRVRVLLDGGPVGGVTRRQTAALDRLTRADVTV